MAQIIKVCLPQSLGCDQSQAEILIKLKDAYLELAADPNGFIRGHIVAFAKKADGVAACPTTCPPQQYVQSYRYCYTISYEDDQLAPADDLTPITCSEIANVCCWTCSDEFLLIQLEEAIQEMISGIPAGATAFEVPMEFVAAQASPGVEVVPSPGPGFQLFLLGYTMTNNDTAGEIQIVEDAGGTPVMRVPTVYPAANGGIVAVDLPVGIPITEDTNLGIISTNVVAHTVHLFGYSIAV